MDSSGQNSFLFVICAARSRFKKDCGRTCVEIKFRAPRAIDATLFPWPHRLDGVEAHEGQSNSLVDFHTGQDALRHGGVVDRVVSFGRVGPAQRDAIAQFW